MPLHKARKMVELHKLLSQEHTLVKDRLLQLHRPLIKIDQRKQKSLVEKKEQRRLHKEKEATLSRHLKLKSTLRRVEHQQPHRVVEKIMKVNRKL